MIRHRWLVLVIAAQIICAFILMNRPSPSDWAVYFILMGSALVTTIGLARLERWD